MAELFRSGLDPANWAMAFSVCPVPLINLIRSYDVTSTSSLKASTRANLLLAGLTSEVSEGIIFHGSIKQPTLYDHRYMTWHTDTIPSYDHDIPATLLADLTHRPLIGETEIFCHNVSVEQVQPLRLRAHSDSLLVPWSPHRFDSMDNHWSLEQFAGGFGGWSFAQRFLETRGCKKYQTLGIECSLSSATQFALTHGYSIIGYWRYHQHSC